MRFVLAVAVFGLFVTVRAFGAGYTSNDNFIVLCPSEPTQEEGQRFAELVLRRAELYRAQVAKEWLGAELPARSGRTVIYLHFSDAEDSGITWAKDDPAKTLHAVYLTTSRKLAVGSTLHHEIAHTILATRYPAPNRLPPWLEEGIASRYDEEAALAARQRIIRSWAAPGRAPQLARLLELKKIGMSDEIGYAAATSLVSFLLTRGDRQTLLNLGEASLARGWDEALHTHYGIPSVERLQTDWESWLRSPIDTAERAPRRTATGA